MSCILCLKADKNLLSEAIQIFSREGVNRKVQAILTQHFWVKPKDNDIICKECWKHVFEFNEFYARIQKVHQGAKVFELVEPKEEQNDELFDSSMQFLCEPRQEGALEESSTDAVAANDKLIEYKLSYSTRSKKKNSKKHGKAKSRSGRPSKKDLEAKTNADQVSLNYEKAQNNEQCDFGSAMLCEFKFEQNEGVFESSMELISELKQADALEEPSINVMSVEDEFSKDALSHSAENEETTPNRAGETIKVTKRRGRPPKKDGGINTERDKTAPKFGNTKADVIEFLRIKDGRQSKEVKRMDLTQFDKYISENIKLSCDICKKDNFNNITILQTHFRSEHNMNSYIRCCGKKLSKRGRLIEHLYTHENPEYFKCKKCGKVLANRTCLDKHNQTHERQEGNSEPKYNCEICSKKFHLNAVYKRHVDSHTPLELRKFECVHCSKRFGSKYLLHTHVQYVHMNRYSRICDICGKKVIGREAFKEHQEQHKGLQQELVKCDICGFTAKSKSVLGHHKRTKHNEKYKTPQQCKLCTKISPNINALKRHVLYMHSLQKTHKCSMCEKSFKRTKELREHFSTHTGDVLYICTFCPRTFSSNANMYSHRKRNHPEQWAESRRQKESKQTTETSLSVELG